MKSLPNGPLCSLIVGRLAQHEGPIGRHKRAQVQVTMPSLCKDCSRKLGLNVGDLWVSVSRPKNSTAKKRVPLAGAAARRIGRGESTPRE